MTRKRNKYGEYDPYDPKSYKVIAGTYYKKDTPGEITYILERSRMDRERICVYYGDKNTGKEWGDKKCGHVGRSTGSIKIPLMIKTRRSMGGGGILDDNIVLITTTKGGKKVLYKHPRFHRDD